VPEEIAQDGLWKLKVYRLALYAADAAWQDIQIFSKIIRLKSLADQLYRAIGSIGANIAEGYSRLSPRDKARFYEYALGSAKVSRDWYYKTRHVLDSNITAKRYDTLS
jgi:four helix bundle protein